MVWSFSEPLPAFVKTVNRVKTETTKLRMIVYTRLLSRDVHHDVYQVCVKSYRVTLFSSCDVCCISAMSPSWSCRWATGWVAFRSRWREPCRRSKIKKPTAVRQCLSHNIVVQSYLVSWLLLLAGDDSSTSFITTVYKFFHSSRNRKLLQQYWFGHDDAPWVARFLNLRSLTAIFLLSVSENSRKQWIACWRSSLAMFIR